MLPSLNFVLFDFFLDGFVSGMKCFVVSLFLLSEELQIGYLQGLLSCKVPRLLEETFIRPWRDNNPPLAKGSGLWHFKTPFFISQPSFDTQMDIRGNLSKLPGNTCLTMSDLHYDTHWNMSSEHVFPFFKQLVKKFGFFPCCYLIISPGGAA